VCLHGLLFVMGQIVTALDCFFSLSLCTVSHSDVILQRERGSQTENTSCGGKYGGFNDIPSFFGGHYSEFLQYEMP
jgi:hypothetical protein